MRPERAQRAAPNGRDPKLVACVGDVAAAGGGTGLRASLTHGDTYYTGVVPDAAPPGPARPDFRLGLGDPALELVATLAGRRKQAPQERLETAAAFCAWLAATGLVAEATCDDRLLEEARGLREALYRLIEAARGRHAPAQHDLELVNAWARGAKLEPQIDSSWRLRWLASDPARAGLARVAASGIELLAGPQVERIRNCANPSCSLMFIDHSRPGRRRWCSMKHCGNRAKTARYRARRSAGDAEKPAGATDSR